MRWIPLVVLFGCSDRVLVEFGGSWIGEGGAASAPEGTTYAWRIQRDETDEWFELDGNGSTESISVNPGNFALDVLASSPIGDVRIEQSFEVGDGTNYVVVVFDLGELGACGDGVDNDADGLVDCEDADGCGEQTACVVEVCDNGADDDADGDADCGDPDCGCGDVRVVWTIERDGVAVTCADVLGDRVTVVVAPSAGAPVEVDAACDDAALDLPGLPADDYDVTVSLHEAAGAELAVATYPAVTLASGAAPTLDVVFAITRPTGTGTTSGTGSGTGTGTP